MRVSNSSMEWPRALLEKYGLEVYLFGDDHDLQQGLAVVGIFGFPLSDGLPLLMGFGARSHLFEACEKARAEVYQRLAFMFDEPLLAELPSPSPSPTYHLDYYHCPLSWPYLKDWLHGKLTPIEILSTAPQWSDLSFARLMSDQKKGLYLIKAISDKALPLTFGCGNPQVNIRMNEQQATHPIA